MITLKTLQIFLDDLLHFDKTLDAVKIDAIMANCLIVKGNEEIVRIGFGVSASLSLFQKAKETGCDCLIVHHSFNFPPFNHYDAIFQNRIAYLIDNKISLFGYHFLLDAHPEVGNNVQIIKTMRATPTQQYIHRGAPWGWVGEWQHDRDLAEVIKILKAHLSPNTTIYPFGTKNIRRIVACSGHGSPYSSEMQDLIEKKIDLYITGEVNEWNRELFREAKINFIAGGHYATEVFGIKALMKIVKKEFPEITVEWLDLENSV